MWRYFFIVELHVTGRLITQLKQITKCKKGQRRKKNEDYRVVPKKQDLKRPKAGTKQDPFTKDSKENPITEDYKEVPVKGPIPEDRIKVPITEITKENPIINHPKEDSFTEVRKDDLNENHRASGPSITFRW